MCEFHLKGQCFHPEKTMKGIVATPCKFQACGEWTNKKWQQNMVEENYNYYQSIVELTQNIETNNETNTNNKSFITRIFSAKN